MSIRPSHRLRIGAADIDFITLEDAARRIASGAIAGGVHLCNAYTIALADERTDVADALAAGTARLPDGMPLVWWAKRHGLSEADRVYGPDLMERVLDLGRGHDTKHYLYGSTPEVLRALQQSIAERWPGADVVGAESPPFRELADDEVASSVARAESSGADVIWVGMGTPKQDLLVHRMAERSSKCFVAVGAAFDFIAGTKRQAPRWVMRMGMEWAYRFATEPRRLFRRYFVYNWRFLRVLRRSRG